MLIFFGEYMLKKLLLLPFAIVTMNSFAANPYTDCGIGAALFPNTNWAAVTSNVIWDAGTTAVISATASEDTCSGGAVETAQLIHDKYELLETDIMLGEGTNLVALTKSLDCEDSSALRSSIKSNLVSVLNTEGYAEDSRIDKSIKLYEAFQSNDVVASSCSVAI
tara:strand:+ start:155 stop:649 length:495 start_codon:yes stop_codon:yes gene_type:complete